MAFQNRFDKPHRSAGDPGAAARVGTAPPDGMHHDGDETKGSVHSFVQDCIEARKASRSVCAAGHCGRPEGPGDIWKEVEAATVTFRPHPRSVNLTPLAD
jgi:hypothetical protein